MMDLRKVKLGDVCELKYGKALKKDQRKGGEVPVYGSGGILGYHDEALTTRPTLIIGRKGSIGEVYFSSGPSWTIDTAYFLDYDNEAINLRWLEVVLKSLNLHRLNKAAAVPGLNRNDFYSLKILMPSLGDQIRIATVLNKVESLIKQREESIVLADEFLKMKFLQMFGDPAINSMSWKREKYGSLVNNHDSGRVPIKKEERDKIRGDYPYFGATGIVDYINDFRFDGAYLLIAEDGKNLVNRSKPIAFMANDKFWVNNHAHVASSNGLAELRYIEYHFNLMDISKYITGIDQYKLNRGNLDKIKIMTPPIDLQKKFGSIVVQIENLKIYYQESLDGLNNLYSSLSQRAFKGELELSDLEVSEDDGYRSYVNDRTEPEHFDQIVEDVSEKYKVPEPELSKASHETQESAYVEELLKRERIMMMALNEKVRKEIDTPFIGEPGYRILEQVILRLRKMKKFSFQSFRQVLDDQVSDKFEYEEAKKIAFDWLNSSHPWLVQSFDEGQKEIVLTAPPTNETHTSKAK